MSKIRFVGLDVHADTLAVAVAEPNGEVRPLGVILNRLVSIRKLVAKLGPAKQLKVCYEAGPCGYVLYWQLTQLGVACEVVAPSRAPPALQKLVWRPGVYGDHVTRILKIIPLTDSNLNHVNHLKQKRGRM